MCPCQLVLGGTLKNFNSGIDTVTDFDDLKTSGVFYVDPQNAAHAPQQAYYGTLLVTQALANSSDPPLVNQYFTCDNHGDKKIYYRRYYTYGGWTEWMVLSTDIPSFYKNYSTLASLASALGIEVKTVGAQDASNPYYTIGGYTNCNAKIFTVKTGTDIGISIAVNHAGNSNCFFIASTNASADNIWNKVTYAT